MKLDFISQPSSKSTLLFAGLQHMQQCQVKFHTKQQKLSNILRCFFFTFVKYFKLFAGFQPGIVGQTVSPTPVLPPGAFASTPPEGAPGQPGFGSLEGEDSLQGASLPDDEFLVSFFNTSFYLF
jgi:hypothetical protein